MLTIAARGLAAARGGETIVPPQDFTLRSGEALVVTGENGAGKSTLLRTMAGLLPAAAGSLTVEGATAPDGETARKVEEVAHYLGHRNAMKPGVTVRDNLGFWRAFLGGGAPAEQQDAAFGIEMALEAVGLPGLSHLPFGYLSAGQQRRAALARLLVVHRPVWLLDEPTAALDAASQRLFAAVLRRHLAGGGIVVAATHQPLGLDGAKTLVLERHRGGEGSDVFATGADEAWL